MTGVRSAALAGALAGLLAGGAAAWFLARDVGRGRGGAGTLRGDVDSIEARISAIDERIAAADARLKAALDKPSAAQSPAAASQAVLDQLRATAEDLRALRDSVRAELQNVDARLADLRRRIDEQAAAMAPGASREGPLSPDDEDKWAARAHDPDPGVRFTVLSLLGRARTDRSVQVSIDRLADEDAEVAWRAVKNLGQFRERDAAAQVVALLDHADAAVRAAAFDALRAMGAPKDAAFDATASPENRKAAAEALRRWAESPSAEPPK
jgi:HEAT repeat protein